MVYKSSVFSLLAIFVLEILGFMFAPLTMAMIAANVKVPIN